MLASTLKLRAAWRASDHSTCPAAVDGKACLPINSPRHSEKLRKDKRCPDVLIGTQDRKQHNTKRVALTKNGPSQIRKLERKSLGLACNTSPAAPALFGVKNFTSKTGTRRNLQNTRCAASCTITPGNVSQVIRK